MSTSWILFIYTAQYTIRTNTHKAYLVSLDLQRRNGTDHKLSTPKDRKSIIEESRIRVKADTNFSII